MDERDAFLKAVLPQVKAADTSIHNGDPGPRMTRTWTHKDPVTLFGAVKTVLGWSDIGPSFEWLAKRFSDCKSFDIEVIAAGASGDLGYLVAIEHTTCSILGAPPAPYSLRVTQIFRREGGDWKIVHRHADEVKEGVSTGQVARLNTPG
jgi:ketosteroid isomerase-like protein